MLLNTVIKGFSDEKWQNVTAKRIDQLDNVG